MALDINEHEVAKESLFARKTVHIGSKTLQTPAKTIRIKQLDDDGEISSEVRGINEIYHEVDPNEIEKARSGFSDIIPETRKNEMLPRSVTRARQKASDDEINVIIPSYQREYPFDPANIDYLIDFQNENADIITIPLFPSLAEKIESNDDLDSDPYRRYKKFGLKAIKKTRAKNITKPIMAPIPSVDGKFVEDLIQEYIDKDIQAICCNFNNNEPTTQQQIDNVVRPVIRQLNAQNRRNETLLYAVNASPSRPLTDRSFSPAANLFSLGLGFDVLGGNYLRKISPDLSGDVPIDGEPTLSLFNTQTYAYHDVPVSKVQQWLPAISPLDLNRLEEDIKTQQDRARYEILINSQTIATATDELRSALKSGTIQELLNSKDGIQSRTRSAFNQVTKELSQTTLSQFQDYL